MNNYQPVGLRLLPSGVPGLDAVLMTMEIEDLMDLAVCAFAGWELPKLWAIIFQQG